MECQGSSAHLPVGGIRQEEKIMSRPDRNRDPIDRRQVLKGMAGAGAALALGANRLEPALAAAQDIQHIVLVMMENRSFDHFLGWAPGADGQQDGLSYPDHSGNLQKTYTLAPDFQGCGHADPDHGYEGGRVQYNGGACDGWLLSGASDIFSIGYYTEADLAFNSGVVRNWMTCDGYFAAILSSTYPNRVYQYAAQTDRLTNSLDVSFLPTICDRLAARGLQGTYYYTGLPISALWGRKLLPISKQIEQFFDACDAGTLPHVSFVDPKFLSEEDGTSKDDHPFADVRYGQAFLNSIYNAVVNSPNWPNTVLIINYDEWGGFFDHVRAPRVPDERNDRDIAKDYGLMGFRIPAIAVSPYARKGQVEHTVYGFESILKMISYRFGLKPLNKRHAYAHNIARSFDWEAEPRTAPPQLPDPAMVVSQPCPGGGGRSAAPRAKEHDMMDLVTSGYLDDERLNETAFERRWFRTGDIGAWDESGRLVVLDRRSDRIVVGAENVSPSEVERVVSEHPAVAEACIVAIPAGAWGHEVAAAVVLRPGAGLTLEDLRRHTGKSLASFKLPRRLQIVDALPRSESGKLLRGEVRSWFVEQVAEKNRT